MAQLFDGMLSSTFRQRAQPCHTHDRAVSVSGAPRQRSGAARSCREGGSAFRLPRKSEPARSVAAGTLKGTHRSGGPAEPAEQVDGRGGPCTAGRAGAPGAHPPPSDRPHRRPHRRRVRTGTATRLISVRASRGRSPPPALVSTRGMLAHQPQEPPPRLLPGGVLFFVALTLWICCVTSDLQVRPGCRLDGAASLSRRQSRSVGPSLSWFRSRPFRIPRSELEGPSRTEGDFRSEAGFDSRRHVPDLMPLWLGRRKAPVTRSCPTA